MNATERDAIGQDEDLIRWHRDKVERGWRLPDIAPWPLRLPIIRHIRALWISWHIEKYYAAWSESGLVSSGYDEWVIFAIFRGFC